jgi:TolA-binding protein
MTTPRHKLADYVRPQLPEARIDRQWAAIEAAGLPGPIAPRTPRLALAAFALTAVLAAGVVAVFLRAPRALPAGALLESPQAAPVAVQLEDGSRVELSPKSQLRLLENRAQGVELELRTGSARFAVTHDRARRFAIQAGPAEVRVIGTRFALSRTARAGVTRVRLDVTEGVVEVRRHDLPGAEPQRIRAGESWSAQIPDGVPLAPNPNPSAELPPDDEPAAEAEPELIEPERAPPPARTAGARRTAPQPEESASELFQRANLARRAGQMREAAEGYAALLAHHPDDPRAGLSAFELGRIRMDALEDAAGAITALEQSLRGSASASFHEDALARIVVASDALGRSEACRAARARYLERYPNGVHVHALQARCR